MHRFTRLSLAAILGLKFLVLAGGAAAADGTTTGQFQVSPDGAATYTVPITVPPGTAGMQPELALQYASNAGNGPLGMGWRLSGASRITRCPATLEPDGFIDPVDFDSNDKLCLDGQRLVAVSGSYGRSGAEYRTELESFTRIKQYGHLYYSNVWFEVRTKNGQIRQYGKGSSAFGLPAKSYRLLWSVNRIADRAGNYMDFSYEQRTSGHSQVLKRIDYTGNTGTSLAPYNSVRFHYNYDRSDKLEGYVPGAGVKLITDQRLYAAETYAGNSLVRRYRVSYSYNSLRKQAIVTRVTECGASYYDCLPATRMTWEGDGTLGYGSAATGPSTWMSNNYNDASRDLGRMSFGDFNGDGRMDIYFVEGYGGTAEASIHISKPSGGFTRQSGPATYISGNDSGAPHDIARTKFGDFNGDGLTDVYIVEGWGGARSDRLDINLGNGQFATHYTGPPTRVWSDHNSANTDIDRIRIGDYNGDGRDDVYVVNGWGSSAKDDIYLNDGDLTFTRQSTGPATYVHNSASGSLLSLSRVKHADFNGDGLLDVYVVNGWGNNERDHVYLNEGNAHFKPAAGGGPDTYITSNNEKANNDIARIQFGDFNGDGLTDVFRVNGSGGSAASSIYISRGNGSFEPARSGPAFSVVSGGSGEPLDIDRVKLIDANSDGLTDIYHVQGYGSTRTDFIYLNQGNNGFYRHNAISTSVATGYGGRIDVNRIRFGDFNGDGVLDIYRIVGWGGSVNDRVYHGTAPSSTRVAKITNGLDHEIQINYRPLTDSYVYTKGSSAHYPEQDIAAPIPVVYSHSSDAPNGNKQSTTYQYEGLKAHLRGRGSLGFAAVTARASTGIREKTEYAQGFPYTGMVQARSTYKYGTYLMLSSVTNTFSNKSWGYGANRRRFAYASTSKRQDYPGLYYAGPVKTTDTTTTYDNNGNATRVLVATYAGTQTYTDRHVTDSRHVYSDNTPAWLLGRLTQTTVTKTNAAGASQTRKSSFGYDPTTGLLVSETIEPGSAQALTTTYEHDDFGNRKATISGPEGDPRRSSMKYDSRGQFHKVITNALGHSETHEYDPKHGGRLSLTGPNGLTTRWQYDSMGRLTRETRADGTFTETAYDFCNSSTCPTSSGRFVVTTTDSGGAQSRRVINKAEAEVSRSTRGYDGTWIHVYTEYDHAGRTYRQTEPFYAGDSQYWTYYSYYNSGQLRYEYRLPGPNGVYLYNRFTYNGLTTTQTDTNGRTTTKTVDVLGRALTVTDAIGGVVTNTYDPYGNLLNVTDPAGNVTRMEYDLRGNKTVMDDPGMGRWTYQYNVLGELTQQTDAKGQITRNSYDPLGRLAQRIDGFGGTQPLTATWTYDTRWIGALTQVTGSDGFQREHYYDTLGRAQQAVTQIDGQAYTVHTDYDAQSRVNQITYPTGFAVTHSYNAYGALDGVHKAGGATTYWQLEHADARGNIAMARLGNGISTLRAHDAASGMIDAIISDSNGGSQLQSLSYKWDPMNCLLERTDNQQALTETFGYDALHRMTSATLNGSQNLDIRYDAIGNITYKAGVGDYHYDNTPHAVSRITGGPRAATYSYDANGNQLTGAGKSFTWTSFNKPARITDANGNRSDFAYGPDRARYKQVTRNTTGAIDRSKTITYVGGLFERHAKANGTIENRHHIRAGGQTIAMHTTRSNNVSDTRYLLRDHLGSVDVVTDEAGGVVERLSYDAHGKRRGLAWTADDSDDLLTQAYTTDRGFTGHEHLDHLALIHMNGRVFDPVIGRFVSADPHVQFPDNSQSYNRYSYVLGNLLSATDPSGFFLKKLVKGIKKFVKKYGRAIVAAVVVVVTLGTAAPWVAAAYGYWAGVATAFAGGFAAGLISSRGDYKFALITGATTAIAFGATQANAASAANTGPGGTPPINGLESGVGEVAAEQAGESIINDTVLGIVDQAARFSNAPQRSRGSANGAESRSMAHAVGARSSATGNPAAVSTQAAKPLPEGGQGSESAVPSKLKEFQLTVNLGGSIGYVIVGGGVYDVVITDVATGASTNYQMRVFGAGVGLPAIRVTGKPVTFLANKAYSSSSFGGVGYIGGASLQIGAGIQIGGGIKIPNGPFISNSMIGIDYGAVDIGVNHSVTYWSPQ